MSIDREESLFLTVSEDHRSREYPQFIRLMSDSYRRAGGMIGLYEGVILGGSDKKVSFDPLARSIADAPMIEHCVLIGDTAEQIRQALERVGYTAYTMTGYDFDACLAACRRLAKAGGCVLLSPACASFDMFSDYEARGREFKRIVKDLEPNMA